MAPEGVAPEGVAPEGVAPEGGLMGIEDDECMRTRGLHLAPYGPSVWMKEGGDQIRD